MPAGSYRAEVKLVVGDGDLAWEEILLPAQLTVPPLPMWIYLGSAGLLGLAGWPARKPVRRSIAEAIRWWKIRETDFEFFIYQSGVTVTESKFPKSVRVTAAANGLQIDQKSRTNGQGDTAFFEATGNDYYTLRVCSGDRWMYRRSNGPPVFSSLSRAGVKVSTLELLGVHGFVLQHAGHTLEIRHITKPKAAHHQA
jgi:hypothetical protein